jgi:probable F420-dependent oxidoreductase
VQIDTIAMGRPLREVADLAREVRGCGFDGLWFTEGGRTAYTGCTAAALGAPGLDIGTAVALAFPRSPMVTAQIAWELADATEGHFVLGLGTQVKAHNERRYSVTFEHPGSRLREYVLALRAIFRAFQGEEALDFHGEFWSFDLLPAMWSPGPMAHPDVPIYVAAVRPWSCRMAGEVADGVHVHPLHSLRYLEEVVRPAVTQGATAAGRDVGDVALVCPVMTIIADTEEALMRARDETRLRIAFYGSTRTYAVVFDLHGWEGTSERLHELQRAGDLRGMAATITDEMLDVYSLQTTWDGLAAALHDKYDGIAARVVMYDATGGWEYGTEGTLERWRAVTKEFHRGLVAG